MTRATNPTGSMLLDRSAAQPGSIDKSVFEKKTASSTASTGQGTVNPNYLRECREDNPEPTPTDEQSKSVVLGNCKITTPPEDLVVDQPFEMSVETKSSNGAPSGQVTFRLFCTIPDPAGGPPKCEDQSLSFSGKVVDGLVKASGKLISPKKSVPAGTKLQYHVVAEHPDAKEKCESPKVEVESGKPPKPLAVWSLGAVHFGFDSSFILPSAAAKIADFKAEIAKHPGAALAVFGHADPVGDDDPNKALSGRRAFAVWCLLAKDPTGWTQLSNTDKWDLRTTQTMLSHLKDKAAGAPYYGGSIDGKTGPKTESAIKAFRADHSLGNGTTLDAKSKEALYKAYMESVCEVTCKPEDFVGDPKDPKRQWACVGCSEFNPVLVFSKSDDAKFRNASDKTERNAKNATNRRATVFLFPPGAKGPGNVEFPCPQWSEGVSACRKQFFEDADKRRNPSDVERTWEKDKDTFACRFYAELGETAVDGSGPEPTNQGCAQIGKAVFRTSSAVPAPKATNRLIHLLCVALRDRSRRDLVVSGHADPPGSAESNQALSEARAKAVLSLATGDADSWWNAIATRRSDEDAHGWIKHFGESYGWDCPDGSISAFQKEYNSRYDGSLAVDGIMGEKSWKALHRVLSEFVMMGSNADGKCRSTPSLGLSNKGWIGFGEDFQPERMACLLLVPEGSIEQEIRATIQSEQIPDLDLIADDIASIDTCLLTNSGTSLVCGQAFQIRGAGDMALPLHSTSDGRFMLPDLPSGEYRLTSKTTPYSTTIGSGRTPTRYRLDGYHHPSEPEATE